MSTKYIWEDPSVFKVNKEDGHTVAMPFDAVKDAISGETSKYKLSLNGNWQFFWQRGVNNQIEGFEKEAFDDSEWDYIEVPSVWQTQGYSVPYYYASTFPRALSRSKSRIPSIDHSMQEIGYYRRTFELPENFGKKEIFIHFEACKAAIEVWVNGQYVGYSVGSMTPHEFDITKLVKDGENLVCAKVYRYAASSYLEDQDMWWHSGIYRDVYIYAEPKTSLRDFYIQTDFDSEYRNSDVSLDLYIKNYSGDSKNVKVSAYLISNADEKISLGEAEGVAEGKNEIKLNIAQNVRNPKKWSAEQPNLYKLVMTVFENEDEICTKAFDIGFKKVEIIGEKILFNGMPLMIRGVNRHDFDCDCGWSVPEKDYIKDFDLMKQANVNAIRTSHYPDDLRFYDYANRYGFYVMDECDLESHGVRRKNVPGSNPLWTGLAVDKMERMVLRDRNIPCIFMWSLGNEAGDGDNFMKMKQAALALDSTRQFHYEGDFEFTKSDVISRMYPDEGTMKKLGEKEPITISLYDNIANQLAADSKPIKAEMYNKPVILCEYAHSMENSLGNFQEYMDDFEKYDNMCGGFIWDWVDQALRVKDSNGNDNLLYGTDFEKDEPRHWYSTINSTAMTGSNAYFCANGVISATREPHPQYWEVRHVYQPIVTTAADDECKKFNVRSRFLFTDISNYNCIWKIECEGDEILSGEISTINIKPLEEGIIEIPYDFSALPQDKECVLTISFTTKESTPGLAENSEIAFDQFILTNPAKPTFSDNGASLSFDKNGNSVTVNGKNLCVKINNGAVESYVIDSTEILKAPLAPNYFRALTDNDIDIFNFAPPFIHMNPYYKWKKATNSVKAVNTEIEQKEGAIKVKCRLSVPNMKDAYVSYTVYSDGRLAVYHCATPKAELLRMGFKFETDRKFDNISWYGRGIAPSYCDRKTGYKIGKYALPLNEFEYTYMRPQEASTRSDVRYFSLTDKQGTGIKVSAYYDKPLMFSALPYSPEELDAFSHINEINRCGNITVTVDSIQQGIGGDMPGQAFVRDKYKVKANEKQSIFFLIEKV